MLTLEETKQLALKICLEKDKSEVERLINTWDSKVNINEISYSITRVIPLIQHRLRLFNVYTKYEKRFNVIYKHWWLKTQLNQHQIGRINNLFLQANIKLVLIKGASLIDYYKTPTLRTMSDIDLLIKKDQFFSALEVLQNNGWRCTSTQVLTRLIKQPDVFMSFFHAVELISNDKKTKIDLHWKIGSQCSSHITSIVWSSLKPSLSFPGINKPDLSVELFLVIIHAVMSNFKDNLNWIIDIVEMQKKLDPSIWQKALKIAKEEKKEHIFIFGCEKLKMLGINIPLATNNVKPPLTQINIVNTNRLSFKRGYIVLRNTFVLVKYIFPHAGTNLKLKLFFKYIFFKLSTEFTKN